MKSAKHTQTVKSSSMLIRLASTKCATHLTDAMRESHNTELNVPRVN
jgi:hypothetical protein